LKYIITDLFETLTLYDNRAVEATWRETPDKKYYIQTFILWMNIDK